MTIQEDPATMLRFHLHELPCPTCGSHELVPTLQCDYYPDGCLWLVRCEGCRTRYHFGHRTVPILAEGIQTTAPGEQTSPESIWPNRGEALCESTT